jgi:hypothetical protein
MERVVVIKAREYVGGAPMEAKEGVRDRQMIYLETGFPTRPLIMGIVEIDPGCKCPLHRHNCEEVYYLLQGNGEIFSDDAVYPFEVGQPPPSTWSERATAFVTRERKLSGSSSWAASCS